MLIDFVKGQCVSGGFDETVRREGFDDQNAFAAGTMRGFYDKVFGVADNMLITTYLSMRAPVFVAPAMDVDMFSHTATQKNIKTLRSYGNIIIELKEMLLVSIQLCQ